MSSHILPPDYIEEIMAKIESGQETIESAIQNDQENAEILRQELEAALWLRHHHDSLSPRPGFINYSRAYLVETLKVSQPSKNNSRLFNLLTAPSFRNHLLEGFSLVLLVICLVFVSHNVILMSELSLPGEPLYAIKLLREQTKLAVTFDPGQDAQLQLEISQKRTTELIALILDKKYASIPQAAERLEQQLNTSHAVLVKIQQYNPSEGNALRMAFQDTLSTETMILSILLDSYPPDARQYIELVLKVTNDGLAALQD
jgi:Domain of unknown function (DUF5667)